MPFLTLVHDLPHFSARILFAESFQGRGSHRRKSSDGEPQTIHRDGGLSARRVLSEQRSAAWSFYWPLMPSILALKHIVKLYNLHQRDACIEVWPSTAGTGPLSQSKGEPVKTRRICAWGPSGCCLFSDTVSLRNLRRWSTIPTKPISLYC